MYRDDPDHRSRSSWSRRTLWGLWCLALAGLSAGLLLAGCPDGSLVTDDDDDNDADDDAGDDDAADDDAADDDAADDDAGDDDIWEDDDTGDDDGGDDDTGADPCTVSVGPPQMQVDLAGTCQSDPGMCDGGYDQMNPGGTCTGGMTCCVHTDQCESVMMGTCAANEQDCDGEAPPGGFPVMGCPNNTPICCIAMGPP